MGAVMERVATEAIRQGWYVRRTEAGQYVFRNGNVYVIFREPKDQLEWQAALRDLTRAGLIWPPPVENRPARKGW